MKKEILANIKDGEIFSIAGVEFIKFFDKDGITTAVAKNSLGDYRFGDNNNFAESSIKKMLEKEFLPKLEKEIGAENIVGHEVDLLSLDGSDKWGKINCKVSLPTFDFYRQNVKTFDKHKLDNWWWLVTPDTTSEHYDDNWLVCVSPHGNFYNNYFSNNNFGVRPFLTFVSSISISCEE
ncbi:MAG: hypothetical protein IKB98_01650 [Clostridia bacterium]|nr:hypothetical protein [Clostridia bacterium]